MSLNCCRIACLTLATSSSFNRGFRGLPDFSFCSFTGVVGNCCHFPPLEQGICATLHLFAKHNFDAQLLASEENKNENKYGSKCSSTGGGADPASGIYPPAKVRNTLSLDRTFSLEIERTDSPISSQQFYTAGALSQFEKARTGKGYKAHRIRQPHFLSPQSRKAVPVGGHKPIQFGALRQFRPAGRQQHGPVGTTLIHQDKYI